MIHIANGDSSVGLLRDSALGGRIVVWREMLCEGPIDEMIGSDEFWKARYDYFLEVYEVGKLEYFDKSIKELISLTDMDGIDEVVMWFEFDLFCQMNLLGAMTLLLESYRKDVSYKLVCTGRNKGSERLLSLSDYSSEDFIMLYENAVRISRTDMVFAKDCLALLGSGNEMEIKEFDFGGSRKLVYLKEAVKQYIEINFNSDELNFIEQKIIETLKDKPLTKRELVLKLLQWQKQKTVLGFGDLQYITYINRLSKDFIGTDGDLYFIKP